MTEYRLFSVGLSSCRSRFKLLGWKFLLSFLCLAAEKGSGWVVLSGQRVGSRSPCALKDHFPGRLGTRWMFQRQEMFNTQGCFLAFEGIIIHHWICSYTRLNFLDLLCLWSFNLFCSELVSCVVLGTLNKANPCNFRMGSYDQPLALP